MLEVPALAGGRFSSTEDFYQALVQERFIVPSGTDGLYGRAASFERVLGAINDLLSNLSAVDANEQYVFPPVIDQRIVERVRYTESFPHLCGFVFCSQPESRTPVASDAVLSPAACYPIYPTLTGTLPRGGRRISMLNWVYRNEPSPDPTRLRAFRIREFVCAGGKDDADEWIASWKERCEVLARELELPTHLADASDPFFGNAGAIMTRFQRQNSLKQELLVPLWGDRAEQHLALASINQHREHFSRHFQIHDCEGALARSACVGFGLERLTLAVLAIHGLAPARWPRSVQERSSA
ncbi:MAG: hypothetical protein WDO56_11850 [Gammaproteobacteria bacterium]